MVVEDDFGENFGGVGSLGVGFSKNGDVLKITIRFISKIHRKGVSRVVCGGIDNKNCTHFPSFNTFCIKKHTVAFATSIFYSKAGS